MGLAVFIVRPAASVFVVMFRRVDARSMKL